MPSPHRLPHHGTQITVLRAGTPSRDLRRAGDTQQPPQRSPAPQTGTANERPRPRPRGRGPRSRIQNKRNRPRPNNGQHPSTSRMGSRQITTRRTTVTATTPTANNFRERQGLLSAVGFSQGWSPLVFCRVTIFGQTLSAVAIDGHRSYWRDCSTQSLQWCGHPPMATAAPHPCDVRPASASLGSDVHYGGPQRGPRRDGPSRISGVVLEEHGLFPDNQTRSGIDDNVRSSHPV